MRAWWIGGLLALWATPGCGGVGQDEGSLSEGPPGLPAVYTGSGYVSSRVCADCHPAQHASWKETFHRSMTQVATPDTIASRFHTLRLSSAGITYDLRREGDELWVTYDAHKHGDDDDEEAPARIDRQVIMLTGSHYEQRIWVAGDEGNALDLLPIAYQITERRWVNQRDLFVSPHQRDATIRPAEWNSNCVTCHATGGQPRTHLAEPATRVGELTIACEACHGPGRDHVAAMRGTAAGTRPDDLSIVNPAKLDPPASAQICGQCHSSQSAINWDRWQREGATYRPGGDLSVDRHIVRYTTEATAPWLEGWLSGSPSRMQRKFWSDGSILPSGREYNGLLESACFASGELSCVSCHTGHSFDRPDQLLSSSMRTDRMCQQCHGQYTGDAQRTHTHHEAGSAGSRCQNCHMPRTSWGMLRAAASHRIDSPTAMTDLASGRPNACNLCHVDRSLGWTAEWLAAWYGIEPPPLSDEDGELSATVRALLSGNAVQRAFAAWTMGWDDAREASGVDWMAPLLAPLLDDPISAVRIVAHRSLRSLPGYAQLEYAFDAPPPERAGAVERAEQAFAPSVERAAGDDAVLISPGGTCDQARLRSLLAARDDAPSGIGE